MEVSLDSTILSEQQWKRIAPELPGKVGDPGATARDNRLFVEAVLWIARTGAPWRDLPGEFGKWFTVYTRFWRWAQKGVWGRIFKALSDDPDFEYVLLDATHIRVHQHGTGAKGGFCNQAIGKSRGGLTTKIAALARCARQFAPLRAPAGPASQHRRLRQYHGRRLLLGLDRR